MGYGEMDIYFGRLLGVDGCIQCFDDDRWYMGERIYIVLVDSLELTVVFKCWEVWGHNCCLGIFNCCVSSK